MILLISLILILFSVDQAQATYPKHVYSMDTERHAIAWYKDQAKLWQDILDDDDDNQIAWLNYYMANRAICQLESKENNEQLNFSKLDYIVEDAEDEIKNSKVFDFITYMHTSDPEKLLTSKSLAGQRPEIFRELIKQYELVRDTAMIGQYSRAWYYNSDVPASVFAYGYNVLMSLDSHAVIFTDKANVSYPIWMLQYAKNLRTDVKIIDLNLVGNKQYLKTLLNEIDAPYFYQAVDKPHVDTRYKLELIKHIGNNSGGKPIYMSITNNKGLLNMFASNLYLEGLAFKYSPYRYNNRKILKHKFEQKFNIDYLLQDVSHKNCIVNDLNMSYLFPLTKLYEMYNEKQEVKYTEKLRTILYLIAQKGKLGKQMKQIIRSLK